MTIKTRLILLLILVILFLIIAPYLVLYSLGYRISFENKTIVATGGIYVRVQPSGANITVDNKISNTTGLFSGSLFVQDLLPKEHGVLIKKDGYYDYKKSLLVKEKEVTKLENVILFSKSIPFEIVKDKNQFSLLKQKPLEKFIIKNSNLYYSNAEENSQLTLQEKSFPILKNIIAFKVSDGNIIWLGLDGYLNKSDSNGQNTKKISQTYFKIDPKKSYQIETLSQNIFLKSADSLLLFDESSKSFNNFYSPVTELKISPDGQKVIYFNKNEMLISSLKDNLESKTLLVKTYEKISDAHWLNSNYIIFNSGNNIIISEIDYRGNVNSITLPESLSLIDGRNVTTVKPEIFFEEPSKKLYVLTQNNLLVSDKLIP